MKLMRFLAPVFILLLAGLIAYLLSDFVHQAFLVPIASFFYVTGLYLRALPQVFWWALLLLLLVVSTLRTFRGLAIQGGLASFVEGRRSITRVEEWRQLASHGRRGGYLHWQFNRKIGGLALNILAQQYRLDRQTIESRLVNDQIDLPPRLREYLISSMGAQPGLDRISRPIHLPSLLGVRPSQNLQQNEPELLELLSFLESELGEDPSREKVMNYGEKFSLDNLN